MSTAVGPTAATAPKYSLCVAQTAGKCSDLVKITHLSYCRPSSSFQWMRMEPFRPSRYLLRQKDPLTHEVGQLQILAHKFPFSLCFRRNKQHLILRLCGKIWRIHGQAVLTKPRFPLKPQIILVCNQEAQQQSRESKNDTTDSLNVLQEAQVEYTHKFVWRLKDDDKQGTMQRSRRIRRLSGRVGM